MPGLTCCCCDTSVEESKVVVCAICKKTFKFSCVDLTTADVRSLNGNKGLSWKCGDCVSIGSDIQALQATILELQKDIKELKTRSSVDYAVSSLNDIQFEEVIQEIQDRERRKKNIMVYGVAEGGQEQDSSRASLDREFTHQLFNALDVQVIEDDIKAIRIGKLDSTKTTHRPIKVSFKEESIVQDIIRKAKRLKDLRQYTNISISLDRTKKQINLYKSVKKTLTDRLNAGETGLRIKYVNGIPKIISEN